MSDRIGEFGFLIRLIIRLVLRPFYSVKSLEAFCRSELVKRPKAYLPRFFLADLYKDYQRNEDARREYLELRRFGTLKESDNLSLAEVLYRLKDYQGVIDTISPMIDRYPRKKDSNWYLAISYIELGQFVQGAKYLQRAIDAGIRRRDDYWRLGLCYDRLGEFEKAVTAYSKALSLEPDTRELRENLASVYVRWGRALIGNDPHAAIEMYRKALAVNPGDLAAATALSSAEGSSRRDAVKGDGGNLEKF